MVMPWVQLVLAKKGMCEEALRKTYTPIIHQLYLHHCVVNNAFGKAIPNIRQSIRQGDKPSMDWFTYGIDTVITYLERRLAGILIHSIHTQGPLTSPRAEVQGNSVHR